MPDEIAPNTQTTPDDGNPIVGDPVTQEFNPADLGLEVDLNQKIETQEETPNVNDNVPPDDNEIVGKALKRGRPARDLADLSDEEKKIFNNMSREAYEQLYPLYKKFRGREKDLDEVDILRQKMAELEKAKSQPASFYDHEEAYYLSPDFRNALSQRAEYDTMLNHWQSQLEALEEGKPVTDLGRDQNGQLALGQQIEPSARVKAQVLSMIAQLTQARAAAEDKLSKVRESHGQTYGQYKTGLQKAFDTLFGPYKDQLGPLAKNELRLFPEFTHGRLETQLMTHALALIRHMAAQAKKDQSVTAANNLNRNGQKIAGPTMRQLTSAPKENAAKLDEEDYKAFKAEFM